MAQIIGVNDKVDKVREALYHLSQRNEWNDDTLWKNFLNTRTDLLKEIYWSFRHLDWNSRGVVQLVDEAFIRRAPERWSKPVDRWVLAGNWLDSPNGIGIVAWLRSSYWKNSGKRLEILRNAAGNAGSGAAAAITLPTATAEPAAATVSTSSSDLATGARPDGGVQKTVKSWKEIVLDTSGESK